MRPEKKNAPKAAFCATRSDEIGGVGANPAMKADVLSAAGDEFSAGADISDKSRKGSYAAAPARVRPGVGGGGAVLLGAIAIAKRHDPAAVYRDAVTLSRK